MLLNPERVPVIVGVGEVVDRSRDSARACEPLALMLDALQAAERDAGAQVLREVDSIDVICEYSWPYADAAGLVAHRLRVRPTHSRYGEVGGESPVRYIHEAALRIQQGQCKAAAVVGAESAYTVAAAARAGIELPWVERDKNVKLISGRDLSPQTAIDHGVAAPIYIYPFFENAAQLRWGQSQRQALAETGRIWSDFSDTASSNPIAWSQTKLSAEAITSASESNRLLAWPYTKHVVANPLVNQGAAVLLLSVAKAFELGIPEERMIYVLGGAAANEETDFLQRDQYQQSHAQNAVLETAVQIASGLGHEEFKAVELYSCFPCVPKMARRTLKLPASMKLSVTGGLSFFGGPLNNYMTHAAASIVQTLRKYQGEAGLLYGQGEFLTKHHALVLASKRPEENTLADSYSVQLQANVYAGSVPKLLADYIGPAWVETFTVIYKRTGEPEFGTVIARTPDGDRLMARVPAADEASIRMLTDLDGCSIGVAGFVRRLDEKRLQWSVS